MHDVMQINPIKPVPWRSRRHPLFALLRARGQRIGWLAGEIKYSRSHVKAVSAGQFPAMARFRAACCGVLNRDEGELFIEHDDSIAPTEGGIRDGAAVRAGYATGAGLSILEEAPQTRSA
jgi:hypothetical protein